MKYTFFALTISATIFLSNTVVGTTCGVLGDYNSDGKVGLEEAIYALQTTSGIKPVYPDENIIFFTFYKESCPNYYVGNVYLYNTLTGTSDAVKDNCMDANGATVNPDETMLVYAEGPAEDMPRTIKTYNISTKTTTTIGSEGIAIGNASFDKNGNILFIDYNSGILKGMNTDGTGVIPIAQPDSPYVFTMFWVSPDYQKISAIEEYQGHAKLVLMSTDGTNRMVVKDDYLGSWNQLVWKYDSSGFLYFHHIYQDSNTIDKYLLVDLSNNSINATDISNSDLGNKRENVCLSTKSGNFISLTYRELYNGQTGSWIDDAACFVPLLNRGGMLGFGRNGGVYFADFDGTRITNTRIATE